MRNKRLYRCCCCSFQLLLLFRFVFFFFFFVIRRCCWMLSGSRFCRASRFVLRRYYNSCPMHRVNGMYSIYIYIYMGEWRWSLYETPRIGPDEFARRYLRFFFYSLVLRRIHKSLTLQIVWMSSCIISWQSFAIRHHSIYSFVLCYLQGEKKTSHTIWYLVGVADEDHTLSYINIYIPNIPIEYTMCAYYRIHHRTCSPNIISIV